MFRQLMQHSYKISYRLTWFLEMAVKFEMLDYHRRLRIVVVPNEIDQFVIWNLPWFLWLGQIPYQLVRLSPSHTQKNGALFILLCNSMSKEKVSQPFLVLSPVLIVFYKLTDLRHAPQMVVAHLSNKTY